jgi:nucleoside-diphosphate-sugar epimerase
VTDGDAAAGPGDDADGRRIFITGATGLLGSHAARRFAEEGWRIRALVRPSSDTRFLEELGAGLVVGDVADPASFSGGAAGCDVFLHAAAVVAGPGGWERYRRVNVEGTRHAVAEAIRSGCRRFVHVSSVAVYGSPAEQPEIPVDEDAPVDTSLGPEEHYERSKRMAETAVRRSAEGVMEWTMLRPAVVMGERDRHFTPRVAGLADRPVLCTLGDGSNRLPVVYAGNVADACRLAAEREEAPGRVYNLADDGGVTQRALLEEAAPPGATILPLPRAPVQAAVRGAEALAGLVGIGPSLVSSRRVWFLSRENPFRSRRIREELGWRPRVATTEGWRRALKWQRRREP